ncbi:MAG TPA: thermonuclease family protein [Gemmatimonadales bacterium]|nr:thermonuclease family protein [Gemmatimonadales bacterium]
MPSLPALLLALVAIGPRPTPLFQAARVPCRVSRVIDGDTFTCTGGRRVRLLSIDAPESRQGAAGDSATAALQRLIHDGDQVTLELGRDSLDRYGRTLAFAFRSDSLLINEELVRRGWAVVYFYDRKNPQYGDRLTAAELSARKARRGWWRDGPIGCRPSAFRHRECR